MDYVDFRRGGDLNSLHGYSAPILLPNEITEFQNSVDVTSEITVVLQQTIDNQALHGFETKTSKPVTMFDWSNFESISNVRDKEALVRPATLDPDISLLTIYSVGILETCQPS